MSWNPGEPSKPVARILRDRPPELCALHEPMSHLFSVLKAWYQVPDNVGLDLSHVDAAADTLFQRAGIGAFALRKIQALRILCLPGNEIPVDPLINLVSDIRWVMYQTTDEAYRMGRVEAEALEALFQDLSRALDALNVLAGGVPVDEWIWLR
jgi:hypothetical protein